MGHEFVLELFTPSTYKVLAVVAEKSEVRGVRELIRVTGLHPVTVSKALKVLKLLGVIEERYEGGRKVIRITEKGKKVMEKIRELHSLLRS